jgi:hypothetical protein
MRPPWLDRLQRLSLLAAVLLYSAGYGAWGLVLLLVTTTAEAALTRRLPWTPGRVDPFLVAFLGAFLISGVFSPYRPLALGFFGLAALTIYLAFSNTAAAVRRDPSFLRPLAAWWVAGGVIAAVWGIVLHRMRDMPAVTPELGQNALGTTLLIATLLSMGLTFEVRGWARYAAAGAGLVMLTGLVLTYTRGAWLGALVGVVLLLGLSGVRRRVAGARRCRACRGDRPGRLRVRTAAADRTGRLHRRRLRQRGSVVHHPLVGGHLSQPPRSGNRVRDVLASLPNVPPPGRSQHVADAVRP